MFSVICMEGEEEESGWDLGRRENRCLEIQKRWEGSWVTIFMQHQDFKTRIAMLIELFDIINALLSYI